VAYEFYVSIEGTKQGKFKGESAREVHREKIAGIGFSHEVTSARDAASGQASGKRQHTPITFVKEWGAASPQIFQALTTNEVLKTVLFEFIATDESGQEEVVDTISLTNAAVTRMRRHLDVDVAHPTAGRDLNPLDEVSLTYTKIEIENKRGKTMAADEWGRGVR
jgi:type VI secretion system secreted protein Hcp